MVSNLGLAPCQERIEALDEIIRVDNAEKLDVIGGKHDAIIRRPLADVAPPRRQREAEAGPGHPRMLEIADADYDVVDTGYAVAHAGGEGNGWGRRSGNSASRPSRE